MLVDGSDGIPDRNGAWGSYYVDPGEPEWRRMILARAERLSRLGVDGFFLDTLDSASGIYADLQPAMLSLVGQLREDFPRHYLVANRGIELLKRDPDKFVANVDGIVLESWFSQWDWSLGRGVVSPYTDENRRLLGELLEPRPNLLRFYLDYIDPQQPDRGALLARRRDYRPGFWSHPFLQSLEALPLGPVRVLNLPEPPTCQRTPEGLLEVDLVSPDTCEAVATVEGREVSLACVGAPRPLRWAVGDIQGLKLRRVDLEGNCSDWIQVALPEARPSGAQPQWSCLELDSSLRLEWPGGGEFTVWSGPDPWSLQPSGPAGVSPLSLDGLSEGQLLWVALAPAGGAPGPARPARTRNVTAPPPPTRAQARIHSGFLTVSWEPVKAPDLAGYRIYVSEPGQPLALPYEVGLQGNYEVRLPAAAYEVKVTSFDTGNHESAPCQATLEEGQ